MVGGSTCFTCTSHHSKARRQSGASAPEAVEFNGRHALVTDAGDDRDWSQEARRVVDQEKEVGDARDPQDAGHE